MTRWLLLLLVILFTVLADLLQSREMKRAAATADAIAGPLRVVKLILKRNYLLLSILCMAISFFAFLALVQTEPISFAVPASAGSFVMDTIFAKLFLKERLSRERTLGSMCVFAGILLVAR
jgi:uncharacterized membrane protein